MLCVKQIHANLLIVRRNPRWGCHVGQDSHLEWVTSSYWCRHTFYFRRYTQTRSTETGESGSRWCTWLRTFLDWRLSPLSGNAAGWGRWIFLGHGHTHWLDLLQDPKNVYSWHTTMQSTTCNGRNKLLCISAIICKWYVRQVYIRIKLKIWSLKCNWRNK